MISDLVCDVLIQYIISQKESYLPFGQELIETLQKLMNFKEPYTINNLFSKVLRHKARNNNFQILNYTCL